MLVLASISITVLLSYAQGTFGDIRNLSNTPTHTVDHSMIARGNSVYVIWTDYVDPNHPDVFFTKSNDGGATFESPINISDNEASSLVPRMAVDQSGSLVCIVWVDLSDDASEIIFRKSTDGGASFDDPVTLGFSFPSDPVIAVEGNNIYVAWEADKLSFTRSVDGGETFDDINLLTKNESANQLAIAAQGKNIYLTWSQYNYKSEIHEIYFRKSSDSGATFHQAKKMANSTSAGSETHILVAGSKVFVAWAGSDAKGTHVFFQKSGDRGKSFSSVKNLSRHLGNAWQINMATDCTGSRLAVSWEDNSETASAEKDAYIRVSDNGGGTFHERMTLSNRTGAFGNVLYPRIAMDCSGNNIYAVWQDAKSHDDSTFFRESHDGGQSFKKTLNIADSPFLTLGPIVAVSQDNGQVYVSWYNEDSSGWGEIFFRAKTN